jgi:putative Holliday junction resolvase
MRYLALDVGDRRIGVAVSDESGQIATPLTVIHRSSKADDFDRIAELMRQQDVGALVVGHPLNDDGTAGPQAQRIERYAQALAEALHAGGLDVPSVLWDEYGSTRRAQETMIATGRKARQRRARIDAVAAAFILQDYLDSRRAVPSGTGDEEVS